MYIDITMTPDGMYANESPTMVRDMVESIISLK
ncbi:hypothetical protein SUNDANCE_78 [Brevibacillus phage Sundance]|nr:hypothetical protein AVT09_gp078 [Brevibacillus phage Sundance]ALA47894.1 hypothetical protein SUNDANCE_78 [Brevibacillus phage Sundance]